MDPAATTIGVGAQAFATAQFELGLTLILNTWQALTIAVANQWGGPDSADKRDWMCGAVAELFEQDPTITISELEAWLLDVMQDTFEIDVDDDSSELIARRIFILKVQCDVGDFSGVESLRQQFRTLSAAQVRSARVNVEDKTEEGEVGEEYRNGTEVDEEDEDDDEEMGDAPQLVQTPKAPVEKVVDEDGFELVQKKGRRK